MKVKSFKGSSDKVVDVGIADEFTYKTNRLPEHYFRIFGGFAISEEIIQNLIKDNRPNILITYNGKLGVEKYLSFPKDWISKGKRWENQLSNGEIDLQIVLPTKDMIKLEGTKK